MVNGHLLVALAPLPYLHIYTSILLLKLQEPQLLCPVSTHFLDLHVI